jgi:hypothetical protein
MMAFFFYKDEKQEIFAFGFTFHLTTRLARMSGSQALPLQIGQRGFKPRISKAYIQLPLRGRYIREIYILRKY